MLKNLIKLNILNLAYLNDLEITKCEIEEERIIIENEEETIILDEMDEYELMDDFNIRVKGNVINFDSEIMF